MSLRQGILFLALLASLDGCAAKRRSSTSATAEDPNSEQVLAQQVEDDELRKATFKTVVNMAVLAKKYPEFVTPKFLRENLDANFIRDKDAADKAFISGSSVAIVGFVGGRSLISIGSSAQRSGAPQTANILRTTGRISSLGALVVGAIIATSSSSSFKAEYGRTKDKDQVAHLIIENIKNKKITALDELVFLMGWTAAQKQAFLDALSRRIIINYLDTKDFDASTQIDPNDILDIISWQDLASAEKVEAIRDLDRQVINVDADKIQRLKDLPRGDLKKEQIESLKSWRKLAEAILTSATANEDAKSVTKRIISDIDACLLAVE